MLKSIALIRFRSWMVDSGAASAALNTWATADSGDTHDIRVSHCSMATECPHILAELSTLFVSRQKRWFEAGHRRHDLKSRK